MPEIQTRRLRLRPIAGDDLPALAALWADPDVMRYLPTGEPRSVEETAVELRYMVDHWRAHGFGVWAVILKETGALATRGTFSLRTRRPRRVLHFVLLPLGSDLTTGA